jgi:hypothetical protein
MDHKELNDQDLKINEALLARKREILALKEEGAKKVHPFKKKFEKLTHKFLKTKNQTDRYLEIYDLGHILEAVFAETDPYEGQTQGKPLPSNEAEELQELLKKELSLKEEIGIGRNEFNQNGIDSVYIYAVKEKEAIDNIRNSIES